jgi:hypothetical protein
MLLLLLLLPPLLLLVVLPGCLWWISTTAAAGSQSPTSIPQGGDGQWRDIPFPPHVLEHDVPQQGQPGAHVMGLHLHSKARDIRYAPPAVETGENIVFIHIRTARFTPPEVVLSKHGCHEHDCMIPRMRALVACGAACCASKHGCSTA